MICRGPGQKLPGKDCLEMTLYLKHIHVPTNIYHAIDDFRNPLRANFHRAFSELLKKVLLYDLLIK